MASGNSINWGRLFPQIPYTFQAYLELVKSGRIQMGEEMDLCVPTGNFGNILGPPASPSSSPASHRIGP